LLKTGLASASLVAASAFSSVCLVSSSAFNL
jgi:hypothetical protein